MTHITVFKKNNQITEVVCDGHTYYGEKGEDIVCAALSSVVQTAALGLMTVAGVDIDLDRDEKKGYLRMALPENLSDEQREKSSIILDTMLMGVSDLYTGFSDFIELEVKKL